MRRESGSVFILVLAVLMGLMALIATLAASNRAAMRAEADRMAIQRADLMIESGIQNAVSVLQQQSPGRVQLSDTWATLGKTGQTAYTVGPSSFRIQILDASGSVNLNIAEEPQLKKLGLSAEQIDSLLDYRSDGTSPRSQGAKDEFYNLLPNPYNAKTKALESMDELFQVKAFTPKTIFTATGSQQYPLADLATVDSTSADLNIEGKQKIDLNSATAAQLVEIGVPNDLATAVIQARGAKFSKMGDAIAVSNMTKQAARALADNTQIGQDAVHTGLVNINTAAGQVLSTIPEMTEEVASAIIDRRSTGFRAVGDLLDVPGVELALFGKIVDKVCVGSRTFVVRVVGHAGNIRRAAEACLQLGDDGNVQVKRIQPVPFGWARERWQWDLDETDRVAMGVSQ